MQGVKWFLLCKPCRTRETRRSRTGCSPQHATSLWPSKTDVGNIVKLINVPSVICGHLYEPLSRHFYTHPQVSFKKTAFDEFYVDVLCSSCIFPRRAYPREKEEKRVAYGNYIRPIERASERASEGRSLTAMTCVSSDMEISCVGRACSWSDFLIW